MFRCFTVGSFKIEQIKFQRANETEQKQEHKTKERKRKNEQTDHKMTGKNTCEQLYYKMLKFDITKQIKYNYTNVITK